MSTEFPNPDGGATNPPPAPDPYATGSGPVAPPPSISDAVFFPDQLGGTMIGRYKLLQPIGEGGMGAVWSAEQMEPVQRKVALKIIKTGLGGDQILARFEAERQALAMMDHPNIARVLDAGTTAAGQPYFVMELVTGIPFTKYCDQQHLTVKERLALFIPVCNAVQHAHQKGIIHRDLKPSNVLIALYDGKPVPKVIDFGLAKATEQKLTERTMQTEVGQILGTLEYMSPEQAELNNLDVDTRADIYSLGVMLYELLTGAPPFTAKQLRSQSFMEILRMIREVEPSKPSTKLSSVKGLRAIAANRKLEPKSLSGMVQGDLDWIVMKCLEKDRTRRYETANQLGQELQRYLADEPVQAGPPSAGYRLRKFLRRNRGPVVAVSLVLLALIVGIIGTSVGLVLMTIARDDAVTQRGLAETNEGKAKKSAENESIARGIADKARLDAEERREEAETLAVRLPFEHYFAKVEDRPDLALVGMASLLPKAARLKDQAAANLLRLHIGAWSGHRVRLTAIYQQQKEITAVVLSPDGKLALTGSGNMARLWETATGKPIGPPLEHDEEVLAVALSADGKSILTGGWDKTARLWATATGKPLGPPLKHKHLVQSVALSADGKTALTASGDMARLWETATGKPIGPPLQHQDEVRAVALSADGKTALTGSRDTTAQLWETATGKPLGPPLQHQGGVGAVALSVDGATALTGCVDKAARLWETATGKQIGPPMSHQGPVAAVAQSADGKTVLTGSLDKTARLWDAATGKPIGPPLQHQGEVGAVAVSVDGKTALTASGPTVRLWDKATVKPAGPSLQHREPVVAVALSADGKSAMTGSWDKTARLWETATGTPIGPLLHHQNGVGALALSADGKTALTASGDQARRWEPATGKEIGPTLQHQDLVRSVALSTDGKTALTGSTGKMARLWQLATGKPIEPSLKHQGVYAVALSVDGKTALTGSMDNTARLWETATGKPIERPWQHQDWIVAVALSADGKIALTGSWDGTARLWDTATGKPIGPPLQHQGRVVGVALSADGRTALTGSHDKTARLWQTATGKPIGPPLQHSAEVNAVALSRDGMTALTGGMDKAARLWKTPQPMRGDPERIRLWTEVITGFEMDELTAVHILDAATWEQRRRRLQELGGPPEH